MRTSNFPEEIDEPVENPDPPPFPPPGPPPPSPYPDPHPDPTPSGPFDPDLPEPGETEPPIYSQLVLLGMTR